MAANGVNVPVMPLRHGRTAVFNDVLDTSEGTFAVSALLRGVLMTMVWRRQASQARVVVNLGRAIRYSEPGD